jgi:hypothetical protein
MTETPLQLQPRPSKYLFGILLVLHVGAMICVFSLMFMWPLKFLLIIILLLNFYCCLRKYFFMTSSMSIKKLVLRNDQWQLYFANGSEETVLLSKAQLVSRWLNLLSFKILSSNKKINFILFKGSANQEKLRRLRLIITEKLIRSEN